MAPLRYRQFRGMAWPPSAPPPSGTGTLPPSKLVLHHVHGYRGSDCRNNLLFTADGELLYFVAAVGVVHNFDTNTQRFFTAHDDDIVAIALHPDGVTVATGKFRADMQVELVNDGPVTLWLDSKDARRGQ